MGSHESKAPRVKIYFLHTGLSSFVKKDIEILKAVHDVRAENNYKRAIRKIWLNARGILWADLVFCWFASIHFLPAVILTKLFRKKLIVVTGGYDVVSLPEIDYGSMRGGARRQLARLILKFANTVVCVSNSNRREAIENARVDPSKALMIYHGFSANGDSLISKEKMVITVGAVTWSNLKRKGLEDFVRVAKSFPTVPFKLVGKWMDDSHNVLMEIATPNVEMTGYIDDARMKEILKRAKVYVQASRHEGFGCSVAEAMLYRCIPVVSRVFALPEVVGDCGFMTVPGNIEDLGKQIGEAIDADAALGNKARSRILDTFPLIRRAEALLAAVENV